MTLDPQTFYERARQISSADGRLPKPSAAEWDVFPFEYDSLVTKRLEPPVLPEPPRRGEDPSECWRCQNQQDGVVWRNDRWLLVRLAEPIGLPFLAMVMPREHLDLGDLDDAAAAELGLIVVRLDRAVRALGGIGRVHVNKWGDGGAHLHVFVIARPEGLLQLRGSELALWEEMLPRYPQDLVDDGLERVAADLAGWDGVALPRESW